LTDSSSWILALPKGPRAPLSLVCIGARGIAQIQRMTHNPSIQACVQYAPLSFEASLSAMQEEDKVHVSRRALQKTSVGLHPGQPPVGSDVG
jgi:hypothetical protein